MSLDGYIAEKDGGIDWLHEMESVGEGDNGYEDFYNRIDTVLMGKKTYDQVMSFVQEFPYPGKKAYVFSRSTTGQDKHVEYVNEDIGSFTESLREKAGQDIWMVGGSDLLHDFIKEGLIDELIITLIPIILGAGVPLFKHQAAPIPLKLIRTKPYGEFVQVHYEVKG
ncbi:hypothetical protein Q75_13905 [Bacillus coahuilensis p1.1.43]|uniref:Bacterial bifunctional deaminase-reductase C-terminal domain-containing protein n=1 Tax=Bacillus coahuilensis p1.1.43 TaxID=1150625 RepID=A0A147K5K6_9BACI|nr:dihydrofolate reductase family protein [Bacillus coahuilensis]KUP04946.1 hypothetical protein Q75_13905 [Bacillus coahuilensis p1.1.43]